MICDHPEWQLDTSQDILDHLKWC